MSSSNDVDSLASIFSASVASTCPTVDSLELSRLSTRTNSSVRTQGFQDVIKTVQTLKLDIYPHSVIERTEFVDEGETFWVERCTVRGKIMAVKRLKLANNSREEFIRRISSLVLELRIMHHAPLRNHSNILSLIGYGWSSAGTATLPYILVDYCSGGNLRQYLNSHKLAASHVDGTITQDETTLRKEKLLADVAAGIHALHAANIIHGDIKLENVLVSVPNEQDRFPIAKICDFGHSIVKGPNEDSQMSNKYRGTQSYNAPEVMTQDVKPLDQTGMKRCDIWAFGILTWETLLDGASYKEQVTYKRGLTLGEGSDKSDDDLRFRLIFWVALRSADKVDNVGQRKVFKDVLRHTLQHRAHFRSDRLSSLQIMKDWRVSESTDPGAQLAIRSGVAAWSYEIFRQNIDHTISWAHKPLIMEDFRAIYEHESASIMAKSSAAWQLGLCYSIGFGIPTDHSKADMYIEQAIKLGNGIARNFGPLIVQQGLNGAVEHCREAAQHMLSIETTPPGTMFDQGPTTTPAQDAIDVQMRRHDALLLEDAILSGDSKTVEVSFVKQVPWTQLPCGESPLVLAMRRQDPRVALALLTRVEYPFRPDKSGRNMFHWLFMIDDDVLGFSNRILERSGPELLDAVNVPATQEMGIYPQWPLQLLGTPLMHAIATGSINTVVALLDLGADPLAVGYTANSIRWTAFHVAVKYHNPDVFVLLTKTKKMGTMDLPVDLARALCMATIPERMAMYGRDMIKNAERIVQLVIPAAKESGPSLPSKTEYFASQGRTNWRLEALKMSLDVGDDAMTEAIIACNESLAREEYIPTYDDSMAFRNPIHDAVLLASQRTDPDVLTSMKLILKRDPIGLSRVDSQGRTCLHLAASGLNLYVVSFLIEQDPSLLHMKDHQGALPLHYGESAAIVEQLLELGASIDALDGHGLSPLLYATNKGLIDVVNCLCRNKAVIDAPDGSPWGPLHMAIHSSKPEIATALIRFGARVNRKNEAGDTPLHVAARRSSHLEIKLLLDHNADPSIQNNMGQLALHVAAEWNNLAAIELLPKSLLTHVSVSSRPTKEHMQTVRDMSASSEKSERYSEVREYHKSLCLSVGPALHNLYETRRSSLPSVFNPAVHATGDGSSTRDDPPFALQPYQMAQAPPTNLIIQESGPRYVQDSTARAGILSAERSALWKRRRHCEAR